MVFISTNAITGSGPMARQMQAKNEPQHLA
jgi:hypothetical protein